MKVLITGGAGYLGSVLSLLLLRAGHEVIAVDSLMYGGTPLLAMLSQDGFEFIRGDIRDEGPFRTALRKAEAVVHLAAIVGDPACAMRPELARSVNQQASLGLLAAAQAAAVQRFVFASTCSNYGRMADTSVLASEDHELRPVSLYAETKVAVERELVDLPPEPLAATVLRFATLYGLSPRMRFDLTVNQFAMEMLTRHRLVVYGEQFWRPYVHVRDAARAIATVLTAPRHAVAGRVFNVGDTAENYRKLDLVRIIQERVDGADVEFIHKAEDPRDYRVSFERIAAQLSYAITRRVPDGVDEIVGAIRSGLFDDFSGAGHSNLGS